MILHKKSAIPANILNCPGWRISEKNMVQRRLECN